MSNDLSQLERRADLLRLELAEERRDHQITRGRLWDAIAQLEKEKDLKEQILEGPEEAAGPVGNTECEC